MLDTFIDNASRLGLLAIPMALGIIAARQGLFRDIAAAIDGLNIFALFFAFPALIVSGILDGAFSLPREPAFWLAIPGAQLLLALSALLLSRGAGVPKQAGTLAMVALFGNVAYLGMPLATQVFGAEYRGVIALLVSMHVAISVSLGPYLLRKWSGEPTSFSLRSLLGQPLFWAPFVGLLARLLPDSERLMVFGWVDPLGKSAAPVALFLLGVYLWSRRETLFAGGEGVTLHVAIRLVLGPLVTACVVIPLTRLSLLDHVHAQIAVLLAGMPAAITTFSIAHDAGIGSDRVASAIAKSTLLALISLPLLATVVALVI